MNRHTPGLNAIAARYPTPTVQDGENCGGPSQLNPDWVEWLMGWPVGWTDITRDLCDWRDLSNEPEDISIATTRRDNRTARIKAIGNGQVPLCAAVAAESGFAFLEAVHALTSSGTTPEAGGSFPSGEFIAPATGFSPPVVSPAPSRFDGNPKTHKRP